MSAPVRLRRIAASALRAATPEDLLRELGGPVLVHAPGRDRSRTRVVATLVHGNEPSGLRAVHRWLRDGASPAVDTLFAIASVEAALVPPGFAHRARPDGRDLNRCFRPPFDGREGRLARALLEAIEEAAPEALVDLHNTTGHTPPYGVAPRADAGHVGLVGLFADRLVRSDLRLGALVEATDAICPSVTIECGMAGDPAADACAREGLDRFLAAGGPARASARVRVLTNPVRVRVRPGTQIRYGSGPDPEVDLVVARDVDRHNFETLAPGTPFGWSASGWPIEACGADGRDVSADLFALEGGALCARRPLVPIMMTTNAEIAASDCLFYVVDEEQAALWKPATGIQAG
jgi:succinylglutamate desuccinylase